MGWDRSQEGHIAAHGSFSRYGWRREKVILLARGVVHGSWPMQRPVFLTCRLLWVLPQTAWGLWPITHVLQRGPGQGERGQARAGAGFRGAGEPEERDTPVKHLTVSPAMSCDQEYKHCPPRHNRHGRNRWLLSFLTSENDPPVYECYEGSFLSLY